MQKVSYCKSFVLGRFGISLLLWGLEYRHRSKAKTVTAQQILGPVMEPQCFIEGTFSKFVCQAQNIFNEAVFTEI